MSRIKTIGRKLWGPTVFTASFVAALYLGVVRLPGLPQLVKGDDQTSIQIYSLNDQPTYTLSALPGKEDTTPFPSLTYPGDSPSPTPVFAPTLESILGGTVDPSTVHLSEWNLITMELLVPLKRDIELSAARYGIDPIFLTKVAIFESNLDPLAYNSFSNDYGLFQIKKESQSLAQSLAADKNGPFYFPELNMAGIFHPQANINMAALLMKYNSVVIGFSEPDQLYAYYVRGPGALNSPGEIDSGVNVIVSAMNSRIENLNVILPLFSIPQDQLSTISQAEVSSLLQSYHNGASPKELYLQIAEINLSNLRSYGALGDYPSTLSYSSAVAAAGVLHYSYGVDMSAQLRELSSIGQVLGLNAQNTDILERVSSRQNRIDALLAGTWGQ